MAGMMRDRRLARAIADAGMSVFRTNLEHKCAWHGARFEKADRWFPSSTLCAHCGWHNAQMTLSHRKWHCGGCGALVERDCNGRTEFGAMAGLELPGIRTWRPCKSGCAGSGR